MARPRKEEKLSPVSVNFSKTKLVDIVEKKASGSALKIMRKSKGYTLADIAEMTGLSPSYISRLEAGDRRYNSDVLQSLAAVFGCEESEFLTNGKISVTQKETVYVPQKDVPLFKTVACNAMVGVELSCLQGFFEEEEDKLFRLPQLLGIKSAFALKIIDDANAPKYRIGDMIYVHPQKNLSRGSAVVLVDMDSRVMIGEMVDWDDDTVTIRNFGKKNNATFKKQELQATYSILCVFENHN